MLIKPNLMNLKKKNYDIRTDKIGAKTLVEYCVLFQIFSQEPRKHS